MKHATLVPTLSGLLAFADEAKVGADVGSAALIITENRKAVGSAHGHGPIQGVAEKCHRAILVKEVIAGAEIDRRLSGHAKKRFPKLRRGFRGCVR